MQTVTRLYVPNVSLSHAVNIRCDDCSVCPRMASNTSHSQREFYFCGVLSSSVNILSSTSSSTTSSSIKSSPIKSSSIKSSSIKSSSTTSSFYYILFYHPISYTSAAYLKANSFLNVLADKYHGPKSFSRSRWQSSCRTKTWTRSWPWFW